MDSEICKEKRKDMQRTIKQKKKQYLEEKLSKIQLNQNNFDKLSNDWGCQTKRILHQIYVSKAKTANHLTHCQ